MVKTLVCIRHSEALHNVLRLEHKTDDMYTWDMCIDTTLTDTGIDQAIELSKTIMHQF